MSKARIAITGIRKAAESVGNYLGRKSLRGLARLNRTADKAYDSTANLVRKAARASDALDNATLGPIGKATRDASAAVIKKTRYARPRARETMGQINRRKGIVNPVYTPKTQVDQHVKDHQAAMGRYMTANRRIDLTKKPRRIDLTKRPRVNNPTTRDRYRNNIRVEPRDYNTGRQWGMDNKADIQAALRNGPSGPRYTSKQVRAGRKVALGAAGGYAASQYFKSKNSNR